ncbi:MAG: hypothetical protein KC766_03710 [Myxococcales bacterium]|nr:hypothetical protein [Myxococcales bacterium]
MSVGTSPRLVLVTVIALGLLAPSGLARGETRRKASRNGTPARVEPPRGWSAAFPSVRRDLEAGKPLVVHVTVPLCSNAQIDCGASWAGQPGRLSTNLYWGAIFGARRIFDGKRSGWERVEVRKQDDVYLERVVYRRYVSAKKWHLERCAREQSSGACRIEQLVVLQAVHGSKIDRAIDDLWKHATEGAEISFEDPQRPEGERRRTVPVQVAGYAGHNRLMDGKRLPTPGPKKREHRSSAHPAFVLACYSDRYFSDSLERAGSTNLVSTQTLMAPEGYLIDAVAKGLGENDSDVQLTERAIRTYARWQRISVGEARRVFRAAKPAG